MRLDRILAMLAVMGGENMQIASGTIDISSTKTVNIQTEFKPDLFIMYRNEPSQVSVNYLLQSLAAIRSAEFASGAIYVYHGSSRTSVCASAIYSYNETTDEVTMFSDGSGSSQAEIETVTAFTDTGVRLTALYSNAYIGGSFQWIAIQF